MTLFSTDVAVRPAGRDEAVDFLMRDRPWSAYGLGYLERASGVPISLVASASPTAITSVVVQAQLPQLLSIVAIGDPEGIGASIETLPPPPSAAGFSIRGDALGA